MVTEHESESITTLMGKYLITTCGCNRTHGPLTQPPHAGLHHASFEQKGIIQVFWDLEHLFTTFFF